MARGLRLFAETQPEPWFFQMLPMHGFSLHALISTSRLDGALVYSGDEQRDRFFAELPIPVVDLSSTRKQGQLPRVIVDSEAFGERAARHFLEKGFQHCAFVGFENMYFSTLRLQGFERGLQHASVSLQHCLVHQDGKPEELPQADRDETLYPFIQALPKPCGLYVATDTLALRLSVLIRELGFSIPNDIALLGSDNREAPCMLASPPLSSVAFPHVEIGRRAAERLSQLMKGVHEDEGDWLVPPDPVCERASTDMMLIPDPDLQLALNWIRDHARDGRGIQDMAKDIQRSRRDLERRFRRYLNSSPLELLQRERVKRVQQELLRAELSLEQIAEQCGFGDAKWMSTVFKRYQGKSPAAYRREQMLQASTRIRQESESM